MRTTPAMNGVKKEIAATIHGRRQRFTPAMNRLKEGAPTILAAPGNLSPAMTGANR